MPTNALVIICALGAAKTSAASSIPVFRAENGRKTDTPDSVDWTAKGVVRPMEKKLTCMAGMSWVVAEAIESAWNSAVSSRFARLS